MTYGSETWALKKDDEALLKRAERGMIRRICGVRLREKRESWELGSMVGVDEDIFTLIVRSRLGWYGHVMRREEDCGLEEFLR